MAWRILDFGSFEGSLSYSRGQLKTVSKDSITKVIPLAETAVIICGSKCSISTGLIQKLGTLGISMLVTDWRQVPTCALQSWSNHTRVGARQLAQSRLSVPRAKHAWQQIVRSKVKGQAYVQLEMGHSDVANQMLALARAVRSGDPQNIEAQAARLHWRNFASNASFKRIPQATDSMNAMLNYGYTILRGFALRSVLAAGLWPGLGVFHHGRSNAFSLVDDIMEPFRPAVDHEVWLLPDEANLASPDVKRRLAAVSENVFGKDGLTTATVMTQFTRDFGRYVEGDSPRLSVPFWSTPPNEQ